MRLAIGFAFEKHYGQKDKGGKDYIFHPWSVAQAFLQDETCFIVAILHDVLEDTKTSPKEVSDHFGHKVKTAVEALTRRFGESYQDFILRAKGNDIARRVKVEDIKHNLHPSRTHAIADSLRIRYEDALHELTSNTEEPCKNLNPQRT